MTRNYDDSFVFALYKAQLTLEKNKNITVPIDIKAMIEDDPDVSLISYDEMCRKYSITKKQCFKFAGSKDAFFLKSNFHKPIIAYNNDQYSGRMRFTLAHEYGHFILGHEGVSITDESNNRNRRLKLEEYEANCFASLILIPLPVLNECKEAEITPDDVASIFNVSSEASKIAYKVLDEKVSMLSEDCLNYNSNQFKNTIYQIRDTHDEYKFLSSHYQPEISLIELDTP